MGFKFEHFFGYESQINKNPDLVLIYGFAGIIFGLMAMILLAILLRKIRLAFLVGNFLNPIMLTLGISFLVAIPPTILFKVLANDVSGVKLIYIWIVIFTGITIFTTLNYQMLKKWFYSFDKNNNL